MVSGGGKRVGSWFGNGLSQASVRVPADSTGMGLGPVQPIGWAGGRLKTISIALPGRNVSPLPWRRAAKTLA